MSRRRRPRRQRQVGGFEQLPRRQVRNHLKPIEVLNEDQLMMIHDTSLRVLQEVGIEFMGASARDLFRRAGASVDEESCTVRLERGLIEDCLKSVPAQVTATPRNPHNAMQIGGDFINFGLVGGPPHVHDFVNGRRSGNHADYIKLIKLAQSLNIVNYMGNQPVAPIEMPAESRHLDCYLANITYSDKVYSCLSIGRERALDGITMMAFSRGISLDEIAISPGVSTVISVNSPRRFDEAMSDGLMTMAEYGQITVVTPFTLMGAMTPVTMAAALVQQNAEALAGIALTQLVRPGAPAVYGAFTSNVDMKSGAPAFGTPENTQATLASGQLARLYKLPYRSSNASASNVVDAQAAYESQMSIWGAVMGFANMVNHSVGWMEGGLTVSFEKMILDAEMLQMMSQTILPIDVNDDTLAFETIRDVPSGGHFFGEAHTLARYDTAFYKPMLADWRNYEQWSEDGGENATKRATRIWQALLEAYEPPALDPGRLEALQAYVAKRKEALIAA